MGGNDYRYFQDVHARRRIPEQPRSPEHEPGADHSEQDPDYPLSLLSSPAMHVSANAPVRAVTMHHAEHTYGNHTVQKYVAVQREGAADQIAKESTDEARRRRSLVSNAGRVAREGTMLGAAAESHKALNQTMRSFRTGSSEAVGKALEAYEKVKGGRLTRTAEALEKHLGGKSPVGRGLQVANYALQYAQGRQEGQSVGESAAGAAAGGTASNLLPGLIMKKAPKIGLVDTGINLLNAGLQLAGAPKSVTNATQTVADATPSSFGTQLASNAGRGLWNLGKGVVKGDWSGLKKQGQDIVEGKAGMPLKGYGLAVKHAPEMASFGQDWLKAKAQGKHLVKSKEEQEEESRQLHQKAEERDSGQRERDAKRWATMQFGTKEEKEAEIKRIRTGQETEWQSTAPK